MNQLLRSLCLVATVTATTGHAQELPKTKVVTAGLVNGTWENPLGEFKVLALGRQRLQIEFSVIYPYQSSAGPMANLGDGAGIALIEGNTAILHPTDIDESCTIVMQFQGNQLIVRESGQCGFGHNVTAAGTYTKASSKKPQFQLRR